MMVRELQQRGRWTLSGGWADVQLALFLEEELPEQLFLGRPAHAQMRHTLARARDPGLATEWK